MPNPDTQLDRVAAAATRHLAGHGVTFQSMFGGAKQLADPTLEDHFWHSLADAVLGAARLPPDDDPTDELRTANLIAYARALAALDYFDAARRTLVDVAERLALPPLGDAR